MPQRLKPHGIEPGAESEVLKTVGGVSVWSAEGAGIAVYDDGGEVASGVTQVTILGEGVSISPGGAGEVVVTIEAPPAAASDLTTMFVPLTTTDPSGDFDFVWTGDGQLIYLEVPL